MAVMMRFLQTMAVISTAVGMLFSAILAAEGAVDSLQAVNATRIYNASLVNVTVQLPQPSILERNVFWSTGVVYHASFVSDFTLTGMILDRGGREGDPLYTLFGERNLAGVIGSAVVFHAVFSLISWNCYQEANKRRGAWRFFLHAAATGINSYFLAVHTYATFNNINVYKRLSR
jgi:hypothetical protein